MRFARVNYWKVQKPTGDNRLPLFYHHPLKAGGREFRYAGNLNIVSKAEFPFKIEDWVKENKVEF